MNTPLRIGKWIFKVLHLLGVDKLNIKEEGGVGRDHSRYSLGAISHVWTDGELGPLSNRHLGHTLIPTLDNLSLANLELEGLSTIPRAVDLLAVSQGQHVVTGNSLAWPWEGGTVSGLQSFNFNSHD